SIDFIVSNPPYIPSGEPFSLSAEVLNEPRIALDGRKNGLHFIKKLIEQSTVLSRRLVALEFGYGQREKIEMILKKNKIREAKFIKDMAGIQRVCVFSPQLF
ncbi:peptide chain release factor N(5)-glutamine methyltransferase, partial [bacterium]